MMTDATPLPAWLQPKSAAPICKHCNGSGENPNTNDQCEFCRGSGWEPQDD